MKLVLCQVDGNFYGIDIGRVQGIEKKLEITMVPNASDLIVGISNLRGVVVPIISLQRKFHVAEKPLTEDTKYIVTKISDMLVGFRVDLVAEIVEVEDKDFMPVPVIVANENTSYAQSIVRVKDKLVLVLDVEGILNEVEKKKITKLVEEQ
ncbi:MAG: purine-binding chemotaxis protein CheW [Lachnospiraceae bacterium]|nr:purine-binding chemotaxis protein CheW [Lachnospiraceae bacterium]